MLMMSINVHRGPCLHEADNGSQVCKHRGMIKPGVGQAEFLAKADVCRIAINLQYVVLLKDHGDHSEIVMATLSGEVLSLCVPEDYFRMLEDINRVVAHPVMIDRR